MAKHDPNRAAKTALFYLQNQVQLSVQNEPRFAPRFGRPQPKKLAVANQPGKCRISKEGEKTERQQPHKRAAPPIHLAPQISQHLTPVRTYINLAPPTTFSPFHSRLSLLVINQVSTTSAGHHFFIAYPSKNHFINPHINHHNGPH